ncbi:MAG: thiamine pyrophosphate-binding protein [Bacteroidales bacterium]
METYYSDEKNVLVLISLLKAHNIKKIIASPGATNIPFVASIQQDPFFEIYSSVDERSAAYLACGLAAESGEPVVISCTGATAARNYLSGLTEAFYRKLPVLAITSTQTVSKVGHHIAQVTDRSSIQKDVAKLSVTLPIVKDDDDLWDCEVKVNKAILELKHRGGGPVHINLQTIYSRNFTIKELPKFRKISRFIDSDILPDLPNGRIAIFIGSHHNWTTNQTNAIDKFCETNDAVVFCDHTSSYKGKYRVQFALAASQDPSFISEIIPKLLIHIGEITGDYHTLRVWPPEVWRVNEDGEIRDSYRVLSNVFEMPESTFFDYYSRKKEKKNDTYLQLCKSKLSILHQAIPELPFSNIWIASKIAHFIPENSTIHFGILNSLRSWNFFELPQTVNSFCNVGGFGIDGVLSSAIGASFFNREKLYFCVLGDLAFFYDMNVLGNRHVQNNLRLLVVNNGKGVEFRNYDHYAAQFGEYADNFIAAAGHFGRKSHELVKHYATDLGFDYFSASSKQEFEEVYKQFISPETYEKPILFEVFTNNEDESDALKAIITMESNCEAVKSETNGGASTIGLKKFVKQFVGEDVINMIRKTTK